MMLHSSPQAPSARDKGKMRAREKNEEKERCESEENVLEENVPP